MKSWLDRWPERLDFEIEALQSIGVTINGRTVDSYGRVTLTLSVPLGDQPLRLVAVFPSFYPYTRFEVFAPDLCLEHHQNPFVKNLCLIGQSTLNWSPNDTLACYLKEQLPLVLQASSASSAAEVAEIEEHQGEPVTAYYQYQQDALILVDSTWTIDPSVNAGVSLVGYRPASLPLLRGAVLEVRGPDNRALAVADEHISQMYPSTMEAYWVRLPAAPLVNDAKGLVELAAEVDSRVRQPRWMPVPLRNARIAVTTLLFPEEVRWREAGDGWLFVVQFAEARL